MKLTISLLSLTLLGLHVAAEEPVEEPQPDTQTQAVLSPPTTSPSPDSDFICTHPPYNVHLVSTSPLIIYLTNFLTLSERAHLKDITKDKFHPSAVADGTKSARRTSQSTYLPRDLIQHCIETRALHFQGLSTPRSHLEPLQLVKYSPGEHYDQHTDWFNPSTTPPTYTSASAGGNRLSSFFTYVHVSNDTTGGGTNFPLIDFPRDDTNTGRWCEFLDCDEPWERGVTFRPVEGNAVFWMNLLPDGTGDPRTLHAGLPVTSGDKIGMNIWTRQAPLSEEARGVDDYPDL
ncbi:2OG-Fe(II) oxygenase superfamily protein [Cercophora scortea]|uniref:2OG-Fe(II) oxygenase superfamily protein n=1 Tax=Cercophora scortea TaxID=314031 RepID=A0AAE0IA31_9PEZI|nr:2OG-Fe(II) oxygenase superfamily protein [Cercophora scortea]